VARTERGSDRLAPRRVAWYRPMVARRADESHRASTPLELFFDLCFVVAVAQASARLHHDLSADHVAHGLPSYAMVFFAIWWAWMNFTWFASAYDTDDGPYRLTTLGQITGALILAAGVPRAFDHADFTVITIGYVVMRLATVAQWVRAARTDLPRRPTALRYAAGVALVQVGWVARLALSHDWGTVAYLVLVVAELLVPVWAERNAMTPWHPHHIAERYGLFTLIVLGESVLAATVAIQSALDAGHRGVTLLSLAGAGLVIVFSMWWLYFDRSAHDLLTTLRTALVWGYGHYFVFASAAAVGAGLAVAVDHETGAAHAPAVVAGYAVAAPVAVYLLAVWVLHVWPHQRGPVTVAFPAAAVLALATPFTAAPVQLTALLLAVLVAITVLTTRTRSAT
jgi:low temperature requirement protein LtrA